MRAHPVPPRQASPAEIPGDRRIVTALFADIVDYSRLVSELDPEDVADRIEEAFGLMAAAVERYGGIVEKFIGDAVFALFGARDAHDDDAVRAALCAIEMTATLERAAAVRGEASLRLRVGIATGEVVAQVRSVGDARDLAVTGETVTTAMRLQELAEPGETLMDEGSVRAARNCLDAEMVGSGASVGARSRSASAACAARGTIDSWVAPGRACSSAGPRIAPACGRPSNAPARRVMDTSSS